MLNINPHIYLISDSTGETVSIVARSVYARFENINFKYQDTAEVKLAISEDGISPGQACVFYKRDKIGFKVLGGGWIKD